MDAVSPPENIMGSTEETRHRREAGDALRRWTEQGRPAGVVRVLQRQGFGTVATGQLLAGTADGDRAGALFEGTMDTVALPLLRSAVSTRWTPVSPAPVALSCWAIHCLHRPPLRWVPHSPTVNPAHWPPLSMGRLCWWRPALG
jgi:hypothetical protein